MAQASFTSSPCILKERENRKHSISCTEWAAFTPGSYSKIQNISLVIFRLFDVEMKHYAFDSTLIDIFIHREGRGSQQKMDHDGKRESEL